MNKRRVLFITGTRADYGKMKSLIKAVDDSPKFDCSIFVAGMHLLPNFGNTYCEVLKDDYKDTHVAHEICLTNDMSVNLANTLLAINSYISREKPDLIVVHGDRIDALAGALAGALNNVMVGHIEGGEVSGTIDESIRHAISKFAHAHFVGNKEAKKRIIQLGEKRESIYIIGSPDLDIMKNKDLPSLEDAKKRYGIDFGEYALCMFHPVTTEYNMLPIYAKNLTEAMEESGKKYIIIYPNNDMGSEIILAQYKRLKDNKNFAIFPSIRFEYFLTLMKNADFMIGNSSAGIHEAGIYGVPVIDIGTRQQGRYDNEILKNVCHKDCDKTELKDAINEIEKYRTQTDSFFGDGTSHKKFLKILSDEAFWKRNLQKRFIDMMETI